VKTGQDQSRIIWQGYAAAIASLLIGLLLLVSLFAMATGLIGGLHETYVQKVKQAGFQNVDDIGVFAKKYDLDSRVASGTKSSESLSGFEPVRGQPAIHDAQRSFDEQSARSAYAEALRQPVTPQFLLHLDQVRLDQINLDPIDPKRHDPRQALTDLDIQKIDIGPAGLNGLNGLNRDQLHRVKPLVIQMALRQWHQNNNKPGQNNNVSPSDISRLNVMASDDTPGLLRLIFTQDSNQIPDEHKSRLKTWINTWRDKNSRIQLSAAWTGSGDALIGRSIYSRLVSVRDEFIQSGLEPSAITIHIDRKPTPDEPHEVQVIVREQKK
jgi:hypothetical protein